MPIIIRNLIRQQNALTTPKATIVHMQVGAQLGAIGGVFEGNVFGGFGEVYAAPDEPACFCLLLVTN